MPDAVRPVGFGGASPASPSFVDSESSCWTLVAVPIRRVWRLRTLLDARAESGSESLMRLVLRSLGCAFEPQVTIPEVGRVDFLVEGLMWHRDTVRAAVTGLLAAHRKPIPRRKSRPKPAGSL